MSKTEVSCCCAPAAPSPSPLLLLSATTALCSGRVSGGATGIVPYHRSLPEGMPAESEAGWGRTDWEGQVCTGSPSSNLERPSRPLSVLMTEDCADGGRTSTSESGWSGTGQGRCCSIGWIPSTEARSYTPVPQPPSQRAPVRTSVSIRPLPPLTAFAGCHSPWRRGGPPDLGRCLAAGRLGLGARRRTGNARGREWRLCAVWPPLPPPLPVPGPPPPTHQLLNNRALALLDRSSEARGDALTLRGCAAFGGWFPDAEQ